jgi:glutamine synthetase
VPDNQVPNNQEPNNQVTDDEPLRWVRLVFVDLFGGSHAVVVPGDRYPKSVEQGAPFDGSALEGRARHLEADMVLVPDPTTLLHLGAGQGRVLCTVLGADGRRWLGDPRTALVAMVETFDELSGGYRAAAELEFYLLDEDGVPVDRGGYFGELEGPGMVLTRAAADRLAGYGVDIIETHLEAGPGQYELDLAPLGPLALADALVLAKQILREEAALLGLRATFMARPFSREPGSGLHLHQHVDGELFDDRGRLTDDGRAFVGGQLHHAPGLAALAAPNVNSYKRLHGGPEAPSHVVWGHSNRAALVRVGSSGDRQPAVEFRLADPSANPYLLIAGLLVAASHGLEAGLDPGSPFDEDPGGFDPTAAESMQLHPLPRDLDEALDRLLADDVLVDAFDSRLLSRLVDGRRAEADAYRSQVTAWEIDRYLDEA